MRCPILGLFTCHSCSGWACLYCIHLAVSITVIVLGALVAWKPGETINAQIAIYRVFNWRLEPISMEKEIRNTRIMGIAALVMGIISVAWIIIK